LVNQIQRPLYDLMRLFPTLISAQAASERLSFLKKLESEEIGEKQFLAGRVSSRVEDITYAYGDESRPVISGFSLDAGEDHADQADPCPD
jgi:ABC-type bacteriocin/lantibiotic exporter with double-glycine peptidase domain